MMMIRRGGEEKRTFRKNQYHRYETQFSLQLFVLFSKFFMVAIEKSSSGQDSKFTFVETWFRALLIYSSLDFLPFLFQNHPT
jgi:hypothetical protein